MLGGAQQGVHNPGSSAGAIQGELDRGHVRIVRRFDEQSLHRRFERIVRVMDQEVALGQGCED